MRIMIIKITVLCTNGTYRTPASERSVHLVRHAQKYISLRGVARGTAGRAMRELRSLPTATTSRTDGRQRSKELRHPGAPFGSGHYIGWKLRQRCTSVLQHCTDCLVCQRPKKSLRNICTEIVRYCFWINSPESFPVFVIGFIFARASTQTRLCKL